MTLPNNQSYKLAEGHVEADGPLLDVLLRMANADPHLTINEFGAGVGQYGHELMARKPNLKYASFDGAGNVEEYTEGFVGFFDLAIPLAVPRADWILCLEVH